MIIYINCIWNYLPIKSNNLWLRFFFEEFHLNSVKIKEMNAEEAYKFIFEH